MVSHQKDVLNYIDGFSVHWYWDFLIGEHVITDIRKKYPEKFVLYTEACYGKEKFSILSWKVVELLLMIFSRNR